MEVLVRIGCLREVRRMVDAIETREKAEGNGRTGFSPANPRYDEHHVFKKSHSIIKYWDFNIEN